MTLTSEIKTYLLDVASKVPHKLFLELQYYTHSTHPLRQKKTDQERERDQERRRERDMTRGR